MTGTLTLTFPQKQGASGRRHRTFLSPSAVSVSIAVTGEPNVVADISSTSPDCTTQSSTTRTCAIPVVAPVGADTFSATLYDGANATGNVLGTGSANQTVVAATPFSVQIVVSGVIAMIEVSVNPSRFTFGTATTADVSVVAYDEDENPISGTYASPITLTNTDTSGTFALSTTSIPASTTSVTLAYSGARSPTNATISATAPGVAPGEVASQTVVAAPPLNLYVAENDSANVTVTPVTATGNIAPLRTVGGSNTLLQVPEGIAVDSNGVTYVTTGADEQADARTGRHPFAAATSPPEIVEFAAGASGNVSPSNEIGGADTGLSPDVSFLALDASSNLYASNPSLATVTVYAPGASGDAAPIRTIESYQLASPEGLAFDSSGSLYVVNSEEYGENGPVYGVVVFAANASGNTTPLHNITGPDTGLDLPSGDAVDAGGNLYVTNLLNSSITVYSPGSDGDAVPIRTISGSNTTLEDPVGIVLDASGNLYVTNEESGTIAEFAAGANGNVAPIKTIGGGSTGLNSPFGLALAP